MAGKSLSERLRMLRRQIAKENTYVDRSRPWAAAVDGNIVHGRLVALHTPDEGLPFYVVELTAPCKTGIPGRPASKKKAEAGTRVNVMEEAAVAALRDVVNAVQEGATYDVWIAWSMREHDGRSKIETTVMIKEVKKEDGNE